MWARLSIVAGLVVGVAVAGLLLGGMVAFAPDPPPPATPVPSRPIASASASLAPSASPGASAGGAAFHAGEPAPALIVPRVGGGTIDLAGLRGQPVWINFMATGARPARTSSP